MLVLSRQEDERIVINDEITIVVVAIDGDRVRIGIEAPDDVPVHRMEVYRALKSAGDADRSSVTEDGSK